MDKRTLVQIIVKDLEELKILSEEVADSQDNSSLVIDLALNKARLLIQEIELLRELAGNAESLTDETEEDIVDEEDDEVSEIKFSDPELEIINFEEGEFPESEEFINEEVLENEEADDEDEEEVEEDDNEEADLDEEELEAEPEMGAEDDETDDLEDDDLTVEEDDFIEEEGEDGDELDEETEIEEDEEELPQEKPTIQVTELKTESHSGIREINIDDPDDDFDIDHSQFSPPSGSTTRPPMREIPKPENPVIGESFQKERSLNDSIGENKSMESKLTNSPIPNLRAAIGLNDRFIFIREIFDNNTEKYNTIIEQLDKMESIQQAVEYLKANLSMQKNEASLKFVDLLKRRFTK